MTTNNQDEIREIAGRLAARKVSAGALKGVPIQKLDPRFDALRGDHKIGITLECVTERCLNCGVSSNDVGYWSPRIVAKTDCPCTDLGAGAEVAYQLGIEIRLMKYQGEPRVGWRKWPDEDDWHFAPKEGDSRELALFRAIEAFIKKENDVV